MKMKKRTSIILATVMLCLAFLPLLGGCEKREEVLKIYNWGEYMDPEVYEGFEDWYLKETGKTISVKYKEFDTNESMYTEVSVNKTDYDLVCPSDYMIERMIREKLLLPLDKEIFKLEDAEGNELTEDEAYYGNLAELVRNSFDKDLAYSVPYVWGTFGIMYDASKVTEDEAEKMRSWDAMFSDDFKGEILMKNSIRDAYSMARIYVSRELLAEKSNGFTDYGDEYKKALESVFNDVNEDSIKSAMNALVKQKKNLIRYEVDDGKDDMLSGATAARLGFFWSCDAGYVMNDTEQEASGCLKERTIPGNKNLMYVVPEEGANVWVDGFVIPKTSRNPKAANYFLKYLCSARIDEDDEEWGGCLVAEKNMDWLGTGIAIREAMDSMREYYEEDEDGFFEDENGVFEGEGIADGFKEMFLEMRFPSEETLARCAVMKDFGAYNFMLDGMWIDVKTA